MARLTCNINDTINALEGIFSIPDSVANEMMTAQANVVAEKQRQVGREMGVYRTGETLDSITAENSAVVAHCFEVIAGIAASEGLTDGFRVITNAGPAAGQTVPHLHFHILAGVDMAEKLL